MWGLELYDLDCTTVLFTTELKAREFLTKFQDQLISEGFSPMVLDEYKLYKVDIDPDFDTWYKENV